MVQLHMCCCRAMSCSGLGLLPVTKSPPLFPSCHSMTTKQGSESLAAGRCEGGGRGAGHRCCLRKGRWSPALTGSGGVSSCRSVVHVLAAGEVGVALAWSSRRRCSASDCSAFWASCRASCSCTTPRPPCRSPRSRLLWAAGAPATSPCRAWNAESGCRTLHRYACDLALRAVIHVTRPGPQQGLRAAAGSGAEEASAELQAARKHALLMQRITARQLCNGDAAAIAPSCRPARASTLLTVHRQE